MKIFATNCWCDGHKKKESEKERRKVHSTQHLINENNKKQAEDNVKLEICLTFIHEKIKKQDGGGNRDKQMIHVQKQHQKTIANDKLI